MRKLLAITLLALAPLLGACAGGSVLQGGTSLTERIDNPFGRKELLAVESAYRSALVLAVNYRRLGLCPPGVFESFERICARREVVLALQRADRHAKAALTRARSFVRNNPRVNAFDVISEAQAAVSAFRLELSMHGVRQ